MNRAIWQPVVNQLPEWIEAICVDLPGHGSANQDSFNSLEDLSSALENVIQEPAVWIGWSLGGMAVTQLALTHPEKIKAIMLVANSPCFVEKQDWTSAMPAAVFNEFANALENDFSGTIQRFLSLQVRGSESGRALLRELRKKVLSQPGANIAALRSGLELLKSIDLREQLINLTVPTSWMLGQQDGLVKSSLSHELKSLQPNASVYVFEKAAHAPFLSHLDEFNEKLVSFVKEVL